MLEPAASRSKCVGRHNHQKKTKIKNHLSSHNSYFKIRISILIIRQIAQNLP